MSYSKTVEIRWADLDPNFHVRHSVYYDFGAYVRMSFLTEHGLGTDVLARLHLGPILFKEECLFKKEIAFGDAISINLVLLKSSPTYSRWTMQHEIVKNAETVAAIMTVEGAWMDTVRRRLTVPTEHVKATFEQLPKAANFEWNERKK